jgi:hypothetical protein
MLLVRRPGRRLGRYLDPKRSETEVDAGQYQAPTARGNTVQKISEPDRRLPGLTATPIESRLCEQADALDVLTHQDRASTASLPRCLTDPD